MSDSLDNLNIALNIAIVGAGPAGIYAAEALLKNIPECSIDIIEALPTPYGLVRSGVAPDHFKIKEVSRLFEKTLSNPRVSLIGNVKLGEDVSVEELNNHYHVIILSHGTQKDRALGIKGENLEGSHTATSFVAWYNSHPWFKELDFNLSKKSAIIIGQGNVAIDVARILAKKPDALHPTDIGVHAINALRNSQLEDIYLIGRRGPLQMACTDKELKELGELEDVEVIVEEEELRLTEEETLWLENAPKGTRRNYEILLALSKHDSTSSNYSSNNSTKGATKKRIHIKFLLSPTEILSTDNNTANVRAVRFVKNVLNGELDSRKAEPSDTFLDIPCELVFRSVGYLGEGISGIPFDSKRGIYPNEKGRILNEGSSLKGFYTSGWIKRGPSGVIGTNKADSVETVNSIIEDLESLKNKTISPSNELWDKLRESDHTITNFSDWKKLEEEEKAKGEALGKISSKFRTELEMLNFLNNKK